MNEKIPHTKKYILISVATFIVIATSIAAVLIVHHQQENNRTQPATSQTKDPEDLKKQAVDTIKQASSHETKGETEKALEAYRSALKLYTDANDQAGQEGVKLQIIYLEGLQE